MGTNNISIVMKPQNEIVDYIIPDDDFDFHSYRILLLLNKCGTVRDNVSKTPILFGRSKFAFFDFLIRNPFYFEKLIENKVGKAKKQAMLERIALKSYERDVSLSIMSKHIRGPWDPRYDNIFSYLVSKQLIIVKYDFASKSSLTREFMLILTDLGWTVSSSILEEQPIWVSRMDVLNAIFPANTTEKLIEDTIRQLFPELILGL